MAKNNISLVPTQSLFTRWIAPTPVKDVMESDEMQYIPAKMRYAWASSKSNIISSPEYNADDYYEFLELRNEIIRCAYKHDVTFLLGSDAPQVLNVPGFSIQHEMRSMADAGVSEYDIIASGTVNPAKFFGQVGTFGQISEGADADLILLTDNPLDDISNMAKINGVMVRGEWLSRATLDAQLKEIARRHEEG